MNKSDPHNTVVIIDDNKNLILYSIYSIILSLLIFVQINTFVIGTILILVFFLSIKSIYRSAYFYLAIWPIYFYVVLWADYHNWQNIKYVLGNSTLFFIVVMKYAKFEDLKKCMPFFLIILFYFFYSDVPYFNRLFAARNSVSLIIMMLFFRVLFANKNYNASFSDSLLAIVLIFAILAVFSFLYYPLLQSAWNYKFDFLLSQKRGIDFSAGMSFWHTGNATTRLGNYYITRYSGLYFNAITSGYIFSCCYVIAMFRKKHAYMIVFALATLLTFAKVGWMIIAYSTIIMMLRKKIPEIYLLFTGIIMLLMFFAVIWYDIIPSGAAIHLVGFVNIITNLDDYIIGQGLGHGGTWSLSLRHLKEYIRLGAGSESGIGTLVAELGVIGCVVYFLTLFKLAEMKYMDAASWSVALLIFCIMVLQENYASPIPAFVVVWMLFEIKEQPSLSKGAIKPSMYIKNISWKNFKLPSFGFR